MPEPAEKHEDSDDDEDEEVHEYDVYEIEYEPEEDSDKDEPSKKSSGENSSGESEIENNIILATVANILDQGSDDSIGADASSDDDDDFTKCDLENRDSWTCLDPWAGVTSASLATRDLSAHRRHRGPGGRTALAGVSLSSP